MTNIHTTPVLFWYCEQSFRKGNLYEIYIICMIPCLYRELSQCMFSHTYSWQINIRFFFINSSKTFLLSPSQLNIVEFIETLCERLSETYGRNLTDDDISYVSKRLLKLYWRGECIAYWYTTYLILCLSEGFAID